MIKTTYEKQKNSPNRVSFSKIGGTFSLPNLVEIQTASFDWFLKDTPHIESNLSGISQTQFPRVSS